MLAGDMTEFGNPGASCRREPGAIAAQWLAYP